MFNVFKFLFLIFMVMISVAFLTLLERKVLSIIGLRLGPNKVSFIGLLQPITDAFKLSNKSINYLINYSLLFYYLGAFFLLFSSLVLWSCFFGEPLVISYKFSFLFLLILLGFNSLNSIFSGWSTFSKFSIIGSLRTVSQLVSYEASLYLILFFIFFLINSYSIYYFNFFYIFFLSFILPICFYIWIPSVLAELNRTPYDFSEGESELVSGFNTEFGSKCFTLIFLAEYGNIIFFSSLSAFVFLNLNFFFFFFFFMMLILWIRSFLPRFRFDKLMMLAWKFFIPFLTLFFLVVLIFCF